MSAAPKTTGVRSRICLSCRTLFDHGEDCRGKGHQTVSVVARAGRTRLFDEVWGPDSRARALRNAAKAGAGGGAAGGFWDACSGCDGAGLDGCSSALEGEAIIAALFGALIVLIGAVVGMLLYWLVGKLVAYVREKMHRPRPHGALFLPPKPKNAIASARGVVRGGKQLATPWREGSAYGWALELHEARVLGGGAMLRDARTAGFDVALEDGRILRVPPGRLRVLATLTRADAEAPRLERLVAEVDRARGDERTVFPFDYARAITIEDGDHIELIGDITQSADAGGSAGYRTSASFIEPVGVPYLRIEKAARVRVLNAPPPVLEAEAEAEAEASDEEARRAEP